MNNGLVQNYKQLMINGQLNFNILRIEKLKNVVEHAKIQVDIVKQ